MIDQYSEFDRETKIKNLTLRLPENYHKQLQMQADRRGDSLHAMILFAIRRHLMDSGYAPDVIKSASGRLFEIGIEPLSRQLADISEYFASKFDVWETTPLDERRKAVYVFGVHRHLVDDAPIKDPYQFVRELGLAVLNFYNRQRVEIDQLAWTMDPKNDNRRMFNSNEFGRVPESLLMDIAKDEWEDPKVSKTGQSQDVRYKLAKE